MNSKKTKRTRERNDNEKEKDVVGTLEQIAATNDDLNIAKRNVFAIYKRNVNQESKENHRHKSLPTSSDR